MTVDEVKGLIEELHLRVPKDYRKMELNQISIELRGIMEFERQTFQKLDELEKNGTEQDMINYTKMICQNITQKEIADIQKIYLEKIDKEYLDSK